MSSTHLERSDMPETIRAFQRRQRLSLLWNTLSCLLLGGLFLYEAVTDGWLAEEVVELTELLHLSRGTLTDAMLASALVGFIILLIVARIAWNYAQTTRMIALHAELQETLAKLLSGFVPICMYCKSVRDNEENWNSVEHYLAKRADLKFSHGICPTCLQQHYPEEQVSAP